MGTEGLIEKKRSTLIQILIDIRRRKDLHKEIHLHLSSVSRLCHLDELGKIGIAVVFAGFQLTAVFQFL